MSEKRGHYFNWTFDHVFGAHCEAKQFHFLCVLCSAFQLFRIIKWWIWIDCDWCHHTLLSNQTTDRPVLTCKMIFHERTTAYWTNWLDQLTAHVWTDWITIKTKHNWWKNPVFIFTIGTIGTIGTIRTFAHVLNIPGCEQNRKMKVYHIVTPKWTSNIFPNRSFCIKRNFSTPKLVFSRVIFTEIFSLYHHGWENRTKKQNVCDFSFIFLAVAATSGFFLFAPFTFRFYIGTHSIL